MMFWKTSTIAFIGAFTFAPAPVLAEDVSKTAAKFCSSGSDCLVLTLQNRAGVTVDKINITQESTNGACSKEKRSLTKNLAGDGGTFKGDDTTAGLNKNCKYKIKFVTTKACAGDKTAHMEPGNWAKKNAVALYNGCGTLNTKLVSISNSK